MAEFLTRLRGRLNAASGDGLVRRTLDEAEVALMGVHLPPALMHGDFAPWNLRTKQGNVAAFDWEYGVIEGVPWLDELHHVWQTCILLDKLAPTVIVQTLDAHALTLPANLDATQARALVSLYLVHGLIHRFELGCDDADSLVQGYRAALRARPVAREVLV